MIDNVREALKDAYDYFDEELYRTAVDVFEEQKKTISSRVKATGLNLY